MSILRTTLAIIVGIIMCSMVVFTIEYTSHRLFPLGEEAAKLLSGPEAIAKLRTDDPEKLASIIEGMPLAAKLSVVLAWCAGAFVGALLAARVSRTHAVIAALCIGVVQTLAVMVNLMMIPHPLWMAVAGLGAQVPLAFLAGRIVKGKLAETPRATGVPADRQ